jgi:hypothetical protein
MPATLTGNWKGAIEIPSISLEESETNLQGMHKVMFLDFMRKMLHWLPRVRYGQRTATRRLAKRASTVCCGHLV